MAELVFPLDYPLSPPKMKFTSEMFHPNGTALQQFVVHIVVAGVNKSKVRSLHEELV